MRGSPNMVIYQANLVDIVKNVGKSPHFLGKLEFFQAMPIA